MLLGGTMVTVVGLTWWLFNAFGLGYDTATWFHAYYLSYNNLVTHGQLAAWAPYRGYGQPNALYSLAISPAGCLTMFAGALFGVKDVLLLFKMSLLLEHLMLMFGTFVLADELFRLRSTVLIVCLGSLCMFHPHYYDFLHVFRIVSLFPLVLYLVLAFFRLHRPECLCFAGIIFAVGGLIHMVVFWAIALISVFTLSFLNQRQAWRLLFRRSITNVLAFVSCLLILGAYLYVALHCMDGVATVWDGRDPATGRSTLRDFLGNRGDGLLFVIRSLLLGDVYYASLFSVFFFVWAILTERRKVFWALTSAALFLAWFSFGETLSMIMYYLPLVSNARYLHMGWYIIRFLLILGAGFGVDRCWSSSRPTRTLVMCAVLIWFLADLVASLSDWRLTFDHIASGLHCHWVAVSRVCSYLFLIALGIVVCLIRKVVRKESKSQFSAFLQLTLKVAMSGGVLFDVMSYLHVGRLNAFSPDYGEVAQVNKLQWQAERSLAPLTARQADALSGAKYFTVYDFAQWDPARTDRLVQSYCGGVYRLLQAKPGHDAELLRVLGCGMPKLRLLSSAIYAATDDEAARLVRETRDLSSVAVIQIGEADRHPVGSTNLIAGTVRVEDFSANVLEAVVDVSSVGGAWLVYADGYHPDWQATVNGAEVMISKAYLGFKAVWLNQGLHRVRFAFHGATTMLITVLAIVGCLTAVAILVWMVLECSFVCILPPNRGKDNPHEHPSCRTIF